MHIVVVINVQITAHAYIGVQSLKTVRSSTRSQVYQATKTIGRCQLSKSICMHEIVFLVGLFAFLYFSS